MEHPHTKIVLDFGGVLVPASLNDSATARAFAESLPATIRVRACGIDVCGRAPQALPYTQSQVRRGWSNGDINYNPGGNWFAVFFADEENSMRYGDQVNIGRIDGSLDSLRQLGENAGASGPFELAIRRA